MKDTKNAKIIKKNHLEGGVMAFITGHAYLLAATRFLLGFAGKFFQFLVRRDNAGNYGFNFTLRLSLWKAKNDEKLHG